MFTDTQQVVVSRHSRLLWGGFDCFLVIGFALTAHRIIGLFESSITALREAGFRLSGGRHEPPAGPAGPPRPAVGDLSEH